VLIADDHPTFRQGLRAVLSTVSDLQVVGEAATGTEAVRLTLDLQPDLVVMDLDMPGMTGAEATRAIRQAAPGVRVLAVTMFEDQHWLSLALRAGVHGYILKDAEQEAIIRAVGAVAGGESIFGPAVAPQILGALAGTTAPVAPQPFPSLTTREREILRMLGRGATNGEIAAEFGLSTKTVANNVSNILAKLRVSDRAKAGVLARDAGLA
jgi:DNA-binding NarL/FixJ family response regulator